MDNNSQRSRSQNMGEVFVPSTELQFPLSPSHPTPSSYGSGGISTEGLMRTTVGWEKAFTRGEPLGVEVQEDSAVAMEAMEQSCDGANGDKGEDEDMEKETLKRFNHLDESSGRLVKAEENLELKQLESTVPIVDSSSLARQRRVETVTSSYGDYDEGIRMDREVNAKGITEMSPPLPAATTTLLRPVESKVRTPGNLSRGKGRVRSRSRNSRMALRLSIPTVSSTNKSRQEGERGLQSSFGLTRTATGGKVASQVSTSLPKRHQAGRSRAAGKGRQGEGLAPVLPRLQGEELKPREGAREVAWTDRYSLPTDNGDDGSSQRRRVKRKSPKKPCADVAQGRSSLPSKTPSKHRERNGESRMGHREQSLSKGRHHQGKGEESEGFLEGSWSKRKEHMDGGAVETKEERFLDRWSSNRASGRKDHVNPTLCSSIQPSDRGLSLDSGLGSESSSSCSANGKSSIRYEEQQGPTMAAWEAHRMSMLNKELSSVVDKLREAEARQRAEAETGSGAALGTGASGISASQSRGSNSSGRDRMMEMAFLGYGTATADANVTKANFLFKEPEEVEVTTAMENGNGGDDLSERYKQTIPDEGINESFILGDLERQIKSLGRLMSPTRPSSLSSSRLQPCSLLEIDQSRRKGDIGTGGDSRGEGKVVKAMQSDHESHLDQSAFGDSSSMGSSRTHRMKAKERSKYYPKVSTSDFENPAYASTLNSASMISSRSTSQLAFDMTASWESSMVRSTPDAASVHSSRDSGKGLASTIAMDVNDFLQDKGSTSGKDEGGDIRRRSSVGSNARWSELEDMAERLGIYSGKGKRDREEGKEGGRLPSSQCSSPRVEEQGIAKIDSLKAEDCSGGRLGIGIGHVGSNARGSATTDINYRTSDGEEESAVSVLSLKDLDLLVQGVTELGMEESIDSGGKDGQSDKGYGDSDDHDSHYIGGDINSEGQRLSNRLHLQTHSSTWEEGPDDLKSSSGDLQELLGEYTSQKRIHHIKRSLPPPMQQSEDLVLQEPVSHLEVDEGKSSVSSRDWVDRAGTSEQEWVSPLAALAGYHERLEAIYHSPSPASSICP
ncbi:unnamed protein product [Choristocarpus tenellus]